MNSAWIDFCNANDCPVEGNWQGINYLETCYASSEMGDKSAKAAAEGIRKVIGKELVSFHFEYPCHSDNVKRWFMMMVNPLNSSESESYVISHQNITERKLIEEKVETLSRLDGLTGLANRRHFDEFLDLEQRRCARMEHPLSLVLLDIDHFKLFNDTYGHQAGDDCLKKIAYVLKCFTKRPSDLAARYGGEEMAAILGNTAVNEAEKIAISILDQVRKLGIPNEHSSVSSVVTASIGVSTFYPAKGGNDIDALIGAADSALYLSKDSGRNMVISATL